jgi:site-specific recombinase XerD
MTSDNCHSRSLTVAVKAELPAALAPDLEDAADYARAEKSDATRRAYKSDFSIFRTWCQSKSTPALPARSETVAAFLAAEAKRGIKVSTIGRRLAAIRYAHKLAGFDTPSDAEPVKATLRGIRRTVGSAPIRKKPATAERVRAMANTTDSSRKGLRDRALLLLGFAGAFRRSELVALDVSDLNYCKGGILVTIRRSKTDQEGKGATIPILAGATACPITALRAWLEAAGITAGPLFRSIRKGGRVGKRLSDRAVAEIVKCTARQAGFVARDFSGHSLRAGFLTSAAGRGASIFKIMDVSRHRSADTLRGYVRDSELFRDHAGSSLL